MDLQQFTANALADLIANITKEHPAVQSAIKTAQGMLNCEIHIKLRVTIGFRQPKKGKPKLSLTPDDVEFLKTLKVKADRE